MTNDFKEIATRIASLFIHVGFTVTGELIDPISDNGLVEIQKGDVAIRLVRDRGQWFIELRAVRSDEWFDSRLVLNLAGITERWFPPTGQETLQELAEHVIGFLPKWEPLFRPDAYPQTKRDLNERERISARERFGV